MARHKARRGNTTLAGIDITPMLDLTFILLIVFMVTAPAMQSRIKVPLFDGEGKVDKRSAVIELDINGGIVYDGSNYSPAELKSALPQIMRNKKAFAISANETRAYGEVIALMRILKEAGIENIDLVTKLP